MNSKNQLVLSALELTRLGEALEYSRNRLAALVNDGEPYASEKMKAALAECLYPDAQWRAAEQQHLLLRRFIHT